MAAFATTSVLQAPNRANRSCKLRLARWLCNSNVDKNKVVRRKVLVLGGTGRVGEATAKFLAKFVREPTNITLAGRNAKRGERVRAQLALECAEVGNVSFSFACVDTNNDKELNDIVAENDLVVHTAGPFQRRGNSGEVLKAAISGRSDYVDVCDDSSHSKICKSLSAEAAKAGVRAWICTGIYPGVSNLLAAVCTANRPRWRPCSVRFSYFTAGTGGIGSTVLASTFLLLAEKVITFDRGSNVVTSPPASDLQTVDFGGKIGCKNVFLLNLPEVSSVHEYLLKRTGGGEVLAKFSTDPPLWNWLLRATARFIPADWLSNADAVRAFSVFSLPIVRFVDIISGARTGIRVDVDFENNVANDPSPVQPSVASYEHSSLQGCVGASTAAFVAEMLYGDDSNVGVFYPEELPVETCLSILKRASLGSERCAIDGKEIGSF